MKGTSSLRAPVRAALLSLLVVTSTSLLARNSFLVAPGRVDFDLSRPNTQSFIITNNGDDEIRLSIAPIYFEIDSKSLAAGVPLHPETKDDLRPFIRVSPRTLALRPGQRRDIRVSVRPPAELPLGDYRAHLLVSMKEIAMTVNQQVSTNANSIGMQLDIKMETGVALYGHKGERSPELSFECQRDVDNNLLLIASNPSLWRFEGWVRLFTAGAAADAPALVEHHLNSLRESRRPIRTDWHPKGTGPYEIRWSDAKTGRLVGRAHCALPS